MISRRSILKLLVGTAVPWLLGACNREPEVAESPPVPRLFDESAPGIETGNMATATEVPAAATTSTATDESIVSTEVTIPDTETYIYQTAIGKREYKLYVALPSAYAESVKVYPVLYVLDANAQFVMATEIARFLHDQGLLPELIIVGIAYNLAASRLWNDLRIRDYTPTLLNTGEYTPGALSFPTSGGAATFLQIIREEIKPYIQEHYRVNPLDTALLGHSAGGLFGLFTLFQHPETFNRYILGSPSIWWDDAVTLRYESDYAANHGDLTARVYMAVGGEEGSGITDVHILTKVLEERRYANLVLWTTVFDAEGHLTVVPAFITRGLSVVYKEDYE